MAVIRARIFERLFNVNERRSEGNENPKNAHTAKTPIIEANAYSVFFVTCTTCERGRNDIVVTSTKNMGDKRSNASSNGPSV